MSDLKHNDMYLITLKKDKLNEILNDISSIELKKIIESLQSNIKSIESSMILPLSLAINVFKQSDWWNRFEQASSEIKDTFKDKELEKNAIEIRMKELDNKDSFDWSKFILDKLIDDKELNIKESIYSLYKSLIINLWTVVESLTLDMWIEVVNAKPSTLAKKAYMKKNENLKKVVEKKLLESDFNLFLQDNIGEFISVEYDFTSLNGISSSYSTIFVNKKSEINKIFCDTSLKKVSAYRNVIIHNNGIIDEACSKMLNNKELLGEQVIISGKEFIDIAELVLLKIAELIKIVDEYLTSNN